MSRFRCNRSFWVVLAALIATHSASRADTAPAPGIIGPAGIISTQPIPGGLPIAGSAIPLYIVPGVQGFPLPTPVAIPVPPPLGGGFRIDSFFDIFTEITLDGGPTLQGTGDITFRTQTVVDTPGLIVMDQMIDAFDFDFGAFRLRESPTLDSVGQTSVQPIGGGVYQIDSFFDIFTEVSIDGGASWTPATQSVRLVSVPEAGPLSLAGLAAVGLAAARFRRRASLRQG